MYRNSRQRARRVGADASRVNVDDARRRRRIVRRRRRQLGVGRLGGAARDRTFDTATRSTAQRYDINTSTQRNDKSIDHIAIATTTFPPQYR